MYTDGIIFDVDGTLWDSTPIVAGAWTQAVQENGCPDRVVTAEELKKLFGKTMSVIAESLFPALGEAERRKILDKCCVYEEKALEENDTDICYPFVRETIRKLSAVYRVFIVSNCQSGYIELFLRKTGLTEYISDIECYGNTGKSKGENIRLLAERSGLSAPVYIGDTQGDCDAAKEAGVPFIHVSYGFGTADSCEKRIDGIQELLLLFANWETWAEELQSIAQAGLFYGKDCFDRERYERIREIAAEMMSVRTGIPTEKVKNLFCNDTGYQTPKLDTRAAVFDERGAILLVKERDGRWSLPGGWVDYNLSVKENTVKEVKEESGLDVEAVRILAIQDRDKHNRPRYAYGVCKVFVECKMLGGSFAENIETVESGWFLRDELPELAEEKTTREQVEMCLDAAGDTAWQTFFD